MESVSSSIEALIKVFPDHPLLVVSLGAGPTIGMGFFMFLQWWLGRKDKIEESQFTREQLKQKELDDQQRALAGEQGRWFAELRAEREWLKAYGDKMRTERDHWFEVGTRWYTFGSELYVQARVMRHDYINERQLIETLRLKFPDLTIPVYGPISDLDKPVKGMEDILDV